MAFLANTQVLPANSVTRQQLGSGALVAEDVAITPTGDISSVLLQNALAEIASEKAPLSSPSFSGTMTHSGDVSLTGTGKRGRADFSHATRANRFLFQTSTTDGNTLLGTLPNGAATSSGWVAYNSTDPDNSGTGSISVDATATTVSSSKTGSGTYVPLRLEAGGSNRMEVGVNGDIDVKVSAKNAPLTDNDLSFDMAARNNFTCTPTGAGTLTFTNITAGQSGYIILTNSSNYAIAKAAAVKCDSAFLTKISALGTYLISYYSPDGTSVYVNSSGALS